MYKIERQEKILDYINKNNRASIAELSEMFKVSKVTIRTDLEDLEGKNLVNKTHGGVVCKDIGISSEIPYDVKTKSNIQQKQRIAKRASKFIKKGDVIILDSGSTMFQLVEWLPEGITVITTDILVAVEIVKRIFRLLCQAGKCRNRYILYRELIPFGFYKVFMRINFFSAVMH